MKKIDYDSKQVRIFAVLLFILIAFVTYKLIISKTYPVKITIFSLETIILIFILIKPKYFFPVFKTALIFSSFLGNIIFKVISIFVYFIILTPISLIMRLFGKTFLTHRINKTVETYYEEYTPHAGIEKQF